MQLGKRMLSSWSMSSGAIQLPSWQRALFLGVGTVSRCTVVLMYVSLSTLATSAGSVLASQLSVTVSHSKGR